MMDMKPLHDTRIFITEDNPLNRTVYTILLRRFGCILEYDRWGEDTVARLDAFNPQLIILDLMLLRGSNGFNIFKEIRQMPQYEAIPIVAISAADPAVALPRCQELGFSGFIVKPIDEQLFPHQLMRLIAGEQVWYVGERYGGESRERFSAP